MTLHQDAGAEFCAGQSHNGIAAVHTIQDSRREIPSDDPKSRATHHALQLGTGSGFGLRSLSRL